MVHVAIRRRAARAHREIEAREKRGQLPTLHDNAEKVVHERPERRPVFVLGAKELDRGDLMLREISDRQRIRGQKGLKEGILVKLIPGA